MSTHAWRILLQCKGHRRTGQGFKTIYATKPRPQIILRRSEDEKPADQHYIAMILNNVENHISMARQSTSVLRMGSPLYADFEHFLTHDELNNKGV